MSDEKVEVFDDQATGLYIEIEPASARKYDPEMDEPSTQSAAAATDVPSPDAETAKKAAKALDAGTASRADAGKPKGASNALLFHQWGGNKDE